MTHFSKDLCVRVYVYLCVFACAGVHTYPAFVCVLHVWLHWFSVALCPVILAVFIVVSGVPCSTLAPPLPTMQECTVS